MVGGPWIEQDRTEQNRLGKMTTRMESPSRFFLCMDSFSLSLFSFSTEAKPAQAIYMMPVDLHYQENSNSLEILVRSVR